VKRIYAKLSQVNDNSDIIRLIPLSVSVQLIANFKSEHQVCGLFDSKKVSHSPMLLFHKMSILINKRKEQIIRNQKCIQ